MLDERVHPDHKDRGLARKRLLILGPGPNQQAHEHLIVVLPPVVVVDPRRAAKLRAHDQQRLAQQPLGLKIRQQGDHHLVQDRRLAEVVAVGVPRTCPSSISAPASRQVIVVILRVVVVYSGRAAELGGQDHQRPARQPRGLEVCEPCGIETSSVCICGSFLLLALCLGGVKLN